MSPAFMESTIPSLPVRRGKVRDIYDLGDRLLLVTSDRISAFDWVLPTGIPDKGRVLTGLSNFWFQRLGIAHHLLSDDLDDIARTSCPQLTLCPSRDRFEGRTILVRKTEVVPIECVVRGYLSGSGWKEYQQNGTVCGLKLPAGLRESDRLPEPIFTPASKEETGHDINISFEQMCDRVGQPLSEKLRDLSIQAYLTGTQHALALGIIIADTKFEWGQSNGEIILIDEALTPDSSRFWPANQFRPGGSQPSYDKQFVRDWLINKSVWDKNSPPPPLPDDIVMRTRAKYIEAYEVLTGQSFRWK